MNIQEKLISKHYKKHVSKSNRALKLTDTLFQKLVEDSYGIRYYIECWYYPARHCGESFFDESWQFEVQFSGDNASGTMNVQLFEKDIDKAEQMFNTMWTKLDLGYYED